MKMNNQNVINKLSFVRDALVANNADAVLFVSPQNRFWLTEFMSTCGFLVVTKKNSSLFVDGRYINAALRIAKVDDVKRLNSLDCVVEHLKSTAAKNVMVEKEYLNVGLQETLSNKTKIKFISFESARLRSIKTENELKKITDAAIVVCKIANRLKNYIKPGMSEIAISKWISKQILENAERDSFSPIVAAGGNGANPHHHPSTKKILAGEFVTCDFGCVLNEYCSDLTRTYIVGKPKNQRLINVYKTVYKSNQVGIAIASNKVSGKQVHESCAAVINQASLGKYFLHSTGHGVGIDVHEYPYIAANNDETLAINSVVTVEPGVYIAGVGGVRIEDMIIIKNNGNKHITKLATIPELK